jgi:dephospho-CoA kinase
MNYSTQTEQSIDIDDVSKGIETMKIKKPRQPRQKKIKEVKNSNILVIDGVRNLEEIETFKRKLGDDFLLVAIQVSDELRYKRALDRGRKDDSKDIVKIKARDHREICWGLNTVISSADIVIQNEGSLEELHKKVKQIFV